MDKSLSRGLIALAAMLIAAATALGAVGSHVLEGRLDASALHAFETAVYYQLFHSLGLMALAMHAGRLGPSRLWLLAMAGLAVGIVLFCGGVYASSLGGPGWIASLAPTGGVLLIASWLTAAAGAALGAGLTRAANE